MKRTAIKRTATKRKSPSVTAKADVLFSRLVRDRDHACVRCGSPNLLQAAHVWSRRYRSLRWRFENAITLCQGCHLYFTLRPAEWAEWCEERWFGVTGMVPSWNGLEGEFYSYSDLRYRALNDAPEKAVDALTRLKELMPTT